MPKSKNKTAKLKEEFSKLVKAKRFSLKSFEKINLLLYKKRNIDKATLRKLTKRRSITKAFVKQLRSILSKLRKAFRLAPPPPPAPPPSETPETTNTNIYARFAKLLLEAVRKKLATYQSVVSSFERFYESRKFETEKDVNRLVVELIKLYAKVLSTVDREQFETVTFGIDYFFYDRNYTSYSHDTNYFDDIQRCFIEILGFSYGALLFYFTETDDNLRFEMYYLFGESDEFLLDFFKKRAFSGRYVASVGSFTGKF
jgi:hypothetical protein